MRVKLPSPYAALLLPVYVPSLLMAVSQEALTILLPLYMLEIGASPAFAALVVGLRGIGVLLFDVPAGVLVARFGDKPVLLGGLSLIFTGLLLLAITTQPLLIGFAAMALGTGHAAWMLGRQSYLADVCKPAELGRAIAAMAGLQRGGALIGPLAGGVLAGLAGYPIAFAAGVASAVVAGAVVLAFARAVPPHENPDASFTGTLGVLRAQRSVLATAGGSALVLQLMRATRQLLVPLFGQAVGLDVTTIGLVYSLATVVDIALFYPSGVLADRFGRKWSAVPSMALYALGLALLPLASGFWSLLAIAMLLGFANGIGTGVVMIIGADLARVSGRHGQFLGLWRLIGDVGIGGAPLLVGTVVKAAGLAAASVTVAGLGLIGTLVMAFAVAETLRDRRGRR
ncbi:MAG TPA: MFS transporter [Gammaproteobacteria bacterium]|nr:MFS transporter [Gammaproteobacteria bacterium]